jgi:mannose-1-phosphate guanylyltransferase
MAGGVGSRFWPISRPEQPKQLLNLFGDGPMLRKTIERLSAVVPYERQLVVTNVGIGDKVRAMLPELPPENVLEEPMGRNTAPAIAWAAAHIQHRHPGALLAVLPADHHILPVDTFQEDVEVALRTAQDGYVVTIGMPPTRPETGYGYIRVGDALAPGVAHAVGFCEKPDVDTALRYLSEGDYLWNGGMFFASVDVVIEEFRRFEPDMMRAIEGLAENPSPATVHAVYRDLPSISIDYAVMERSDKVAVVPARFGWSDVGSWDTIHDFRAAGTSSYHRGTVVEIQGEGNVLYAEGGAIAAVGLSDMIVVHTAEATLVCPRDQAQRVRDAQQQIKALNRDGTETSSAS